jgi:hypothetical protein
MVKINHFDGFGFNFIQIARLLKKIPPAWRRLVGNSDDATRQWAPHFTLAVMVRCSD